MRLADHWFYGKRGKTEREFVFDADEARHAARALRLRVGDALQWTDGAGGRYMGRVIRQDRSEMAAEVESHGVDSLPPTRRLAVGALHDATRLEWLIEKATELGCTQIHVLRTERVQKVRYRMSRLTAKAVAAMKQSGRSTLPVLAEADYAAYVEEHVDDSFIVAHCIAERRREALSEVGDRVTGVLIGPEGDFTPAEVDAAVQHGARPVTLGTARLRTETAAVSALAWLNFRADRLTGCSQSA